MMIMIAVAVMVAATMAQHLGLTEAIARIVLKIAQCNMCCTFWTCLAVLWLCDCPLTVAALLSIVAAYVSNWFVLLLVLIEKTYNKLWQRLK